MRHLPEKSGLEGESTTLIKTYYGEGLFDNKQGVMFTENIEAEIRTILIENHGVGIMGGFYSEELPICMFSELMVEMLGCKNLRSPSGKRGVEGRSRREYNCIYCINR